MKIPDSMAKTLAPTLAKLQKHSPHILFGAGIAGAVTSTVLACRATLKVGDKLDQITSDVHAIKKDRQLHLSHRRESPVIDTRRDLAFAYAHGTFDIVKLYAPAVIVGAASVAALTKSHVTLTKRNSALAAAYVAIEKAFTEYRGRVREEVGEERELELYHDGKFHEVTNPDGSKSKVLKLNDVVRDRLARVFDESNRNWQPNAETNRMFLEANQRYFNDRLMTHKHVFLNEVYDALGFERTSEGALLGWTYGQPGNQGYIEFGIYNTSNADFVINGDRSVLLDFNVDGYIYDLI